LFRVTPEINSQEMTSILQFARRTQWQFPAKLGYERPRSCDSSGWSLGNFREHMKTQFLNRTENAPLDVFVVRKLGLPGHPELAMGAIAFRRCARVQWRGRQCAADSR
jgi:hypothetical protein